MNYRVLMNYCGLKIKIHRILHYYLIFDFNEITYEQQVGPPIVLTYLGFFPRLKWPQRTVSDVGYNMRRDCHHRTISR